VRHAVVVLGAALAVACAAPPPAQEPAPRPAAEPATPTRAFLPPVTSRPPPEVELEIEFPPEGGVVAEGGMAYVAGRTRSPFGSLGRIDAVLVIDASGSTAQPSGTDVDGDGTTAQLHVGGARDAGDSVLAAEVAAARGLLDSMDARRARIAVVGFSGYGYPDRNRDGRSHRALSRSSAWTETPLTRERVALGAALDRLLARGADGMTDMAGALDRAVAALTGGPEAGAAPDPAAERVVVFLTDGTPTLPEPARPADNERAVVRAAERARAAGVRVHTFAIGPAALERPVAAVAMARATGGVFTPVRDPAHLAIAMQAVRVADYESLEIRNLTTGDGPERLRVGGDGTWDALVPLAAGRNRLQVRAAVAGASVVRQRTVHYAPGRAEPFVPPDLADRRTRLQDRDLRVSGEGDIEARVLEALERDRRAVERAVRRPMKELELEVAPGDGRERPR